MKYNVGTLNSLFERTRDSIDYFRVEKNVNSGYNAHFHRTVEIYCVNRGAVKVYVDENEYNLTAGDAIFIDCLRIHSYECKNAEITFALIGPKYMQPFQEIFGDRIPPTLLADKEANRPLFEYLKTIDAKKDDFQPLERISCACMILNLIVEAYGTVPPPPHKSHTRADVTEIIQYISDHASEDLSLSLLAKKFNYTPVSLSHLFNRYIKMDIRNFINSVRIQNYLVLRSFPENKDKSVLELAMQCGFNSMATFYRAYKSALQQ